MARIKALSGPLSVLAFGLVFLGVGLGFILHDQRFETDGQRIDATVTLKRLAHRTSTQASAPSRSRTDHEVVYVFEVEGKGYDGEGKVSAETWEALRPGASIEVVHLRSDPTVNRPVEDDNGPFPWIFAACGGALTLVGGALTLRGARRPAAGG